MKKILLLLLVMVGTLNVHSQNAYTYLTFETTDGAKFSVSVSSLTLTISGTTLTTGSQTFTISNLSKMYFSESDETTTGIESVSIETLEDVTDIYDLQGHKVEKEQMRKGVYIVKTKKGNHKILVK